MKVKKIMALILSVSLLLTSLSIGVAATPEDTYTVGTELYYNDYRQVDAQIFEDPNSNGYYFRQAVGYNTTTLGSPTEGQYAIGEENGNKFVTIRAVSKNGSVTEPRWVSFYSTTVEPAGYILEYRVRPNWTSTTARFANRADSTFGMRLPTFNNGKIYPCGTQVVSGYEIGTYTVGEWVTITNVYHNTADASGNIIRDTYINGKYANTNLCTTNNVTDLLTEKKIQFTFNLMFAEEDESVDIDYVKVVPLNDTFAAKLSRTENVDTKTLNVKFNNIPTQEELLTKISVSDEEGNLIAVKSAEYVNDANVGNEYAQSINLTLEESLKTKSPYTISFNDLTDSMGNVLNTTIPFVTRDARQLISDISLNGTDVLLPGTQKVNVKIVNEINEPIEPVLFAVHKSAENAINQIDTVKMEVEKMAGTVEKSVPIEIAADDASVQLFAVKGVQTPYSFSNVVEYTATEKTVIAKEDFEAANVEGLTASYMYDAEKDALTISTTLPDSETRTVVLYVLKEGKTLADIDLAKPEETLVYAGAAQPNNRILSYSFTVGEENATFPIVAYHSDGGVLLNESYEYVSAIYVQKRLEEDVNLTTDISVIAGYITEFGKYLELDMAAYDNLTAEGAKDYLHQAIISFRDGKDTKKFADTADFKAAYDLALQLTDLYYGANGFQTLLDNKNLSNESAYTVLSEQMQKDAQDYLLTELRKNKTYSEAEIKTAVCEKVYVAAVYKAASSLQIESIIKAAGFDLTAYNKLDEPEQVDKALKRTLYASTEALQTAFEEAVKEQKKKEDKKTSSSSSSRPSGGGGAITINPVPVVTPAPTTQPDEEETQQPAEPKYPFTDLENYGWAIESISALYEKGVVSGKDADSYDPGASVTRAEFIKMLSGALKVEGTGIENPFTDIHADDWYYTYVLAAYEKGITGGVTETSFAPNDTVTREMAATLLKRAAGDVFEAGEKAFNDSDKISDWAKEAVSLLASNGIINGYETGDFNPQGALNRAEAAKLIYEILKIGGNV